MRLSENRFRVQSISYLLSRLHTLGQRLTMMDVFVVFRVLEKYCSFCLARSSKARLLGCVSVVVVLLLLRGAHNAQAVGLFPLDGSIMSTKVWFSITWNGMFAHFLRRHRADSPQVCRVSRGHQVPLPPRAIHTLKNPSVCLFGNEGNHLHRLDKQQRQQRQHHKFEHFLAHRQNSGRLS